MRPRSAARRRAAGVAAIAAAVVLADQVTKSVALAELRDGPVHVIGPFSFELGLNTGIAFSLFTSVGLPIVLIAGCLVAVVVWLGRGNPSPLGTVALGLVVGGSVGNLSDRIFRSGGAVVDFVHTGFWPTFNVADSAIVVGCALLAVVFWRAEGPGGGEGQARA